MVQSQCVKHAISDGQNLIIIIIIIIIIYLYQATKIRNSERKQKTTSSPST